MTDTKSCGTSSEGYSYADEVGWLCEEEAETDGSALRRPCQG